MYEMYTIILQINPMSSFLFEKEEFNCACFQSNSNNVRKIFRSESCQSSSNSSKDKSLLMVKKEGDKIISQKKSLRKQKAIDHSSFDINNISKQEQNGNNNIVQIMRENPKHLQPRLSVSDYTSTLKFQSILGQRHGPFYSIRQKAQVSPIISQQIISVNHLNRVQHFAYSQPPMKYNQYEKLVQQEFRRDLYEFELEMDQKGKQGAKINVKDTEEKLKQKDKVIHKEQEHRNQIQMKQQKQNQNQFLTQQQIQELQKFIKKATQQNEQKQERQKRPALQKIESLPQICHDKSFQSIQHLPNPKQSSRRQRRDSFRNSSVSYKGRQLLTKKIKDRMYAKEIESQKDGSSDDESEMSEVVGRGWDGMTEQRMELEELDEMINDKKNGHSQTMVTQESHIKNSEIKTFTDYSNSFISPKSQYSKPTTMLPFGGGIGKYGITGMSYQHIDELRRVRSSLYDDGRI